MSVNEYKIRRIAVVLFTAYSILMIWLLFGQRIGFLPEGRYLDNLFNKVNLRPFVTISSQIERVRGDSYLARHCFINLSGNVVMFIPAGLLMPVIWRSLQSVLRFIGCMTLGIFLIELIQLFTLLGSLDVDDYILNIIGTLIGFAVNRAVYFVFKKKSGRR